MEVPNGSGKEHASDKTTLAPQILWITGLPLAGKTTVANILEQETNAVVLDPDEIRIELFPDFDPTSKLDKDVEDTQMKATHIEVQKRISEAIEEGTPVVYPAVLKSDKSRTAVQAVSENLGAPLTVVYLEADESEIDQRLEDRRVNGSFSSIQKREEYDQIEKEYDSPENKDLHINTSRLSENETANMIIQYAEDV